MYLLLDLAGDLRVGGVGNTLAAFVLHIDGCSGGLLFDRVEDVRIELMEKEDCVQLIACGSIIAIGAFLEGALGGAQQSDLHCNDDVWRGNNKGS